MDVLMDSITEKQAIEWAAFTNECPPPLEVIIDQIALVASVFANALMGKKGGRKITPALFIPKYSKSNTPVSSKKDIKLQALEFAKNFGTDRAKEQLEKNRKPYESEKHVDMTRTKPPRKKTPIGGR